MPRLGRPRTLDVEQKTFSQAARAYPHTPASARRSLHTWNQIHVRQCLSAESCKMKQPVLASCLLYLQPVSQHETEMFCTGDSLFLIDSLAKPSNHQHQKRQHTLGRPLPMPHFASASSSIKNYAQKPMLCFSHMLPEVMFCSRMLTQLQAMWLPGRHLQGGSNSGHQLPLKASLLRGVSALG